MRFTLKAFQEWTIQHPGQEIIVFIRDGRFDFMAPNTIEGELLLNELDADDGSTQRISTDAWMADRLSGGLA